MTHQSQSLHYLDRMIFPNTNQLVLPLPATQLIPKPSDASMLLLLLISNTLLL